MTTLDSSSCRSTPDERGETCAPFRDDAIAFFAAHGVTIERVMTDNARDYTISTALPGCDRRGRHLRIGPYDPRPTARLNGSTER